MDNSGERKSGKIIGSREPRGRARAKAGKFEQVYSNKENDGKRGAACRQSKITRSQMGEVVVTLVRVDEEKCAEVFCSNEDP